MLSYAPAFLTGWAKCIFVFITKFAGKLWRCEFGLASALLYLTFFW